MNKKTQTCKACGQEIAKSAKTCPHCGAKNKKGNPVLAGILLVVIIAIIIGVSSGNDKPTKVDTANPSTQTQTDNTENQNNTEDDTRFAVGESVQLKDVTATFVDVTTSNGSTYNKPADGNVFVLCEFTIENGTDKELTVSSIMSFEAYCDDFACNFSLSALLEKESKGQLDGTIAPGKKLNGVIGYEVPENWQELEVHFAPDVWSNKDIVFVATNN